MAEFHRFPTPSIADADLARAAAEGDPKAAPVIFDRYASLVRGMLRRNLGPTADVDDLVQEVFLRYFRAPGALRDGASTRSATPVARSAAPLTKRTVDAVARSCAFASKPASVARADGSHTALG